MRDDISQSGDEIRVVGLCGSLRPISSTRMALAAALRGAEDVAAEVSLIDVREYTLPFSDGKQSESPASPDVVRLRVKIARRGSSLERRSIMRA
jgi:NAD(P)H-dependent FMN reductase